jgi:hypothetical protein
LNELIKRSGDKPGEFGEAASTAAKTAFTFFETGKARKDVGREPSRRRIHDRGPDKGRLAAVIQQ